MLLGSVYRFDSDLLPDGHPGDDYPLYEVVGVNDGGFDRDCHTIELEPVGDLGQWCTQYRDVFESSYLKVADSVEELDGAATTHEM